jgi:TatD DNase family protein
VVHCFTGTQKQLDDYLELNCYIGVTGWICDEKRNIELRKTIKNIPLTKLMIETDCPYLIPKNLPNKPKNNRNEPYNLNHIVAEISMLMDIGEDILRKETFKNTKKFFLNKI